MSRFYYPNVVGKGQQVKMQRRGPVFTPTVVLTSNMSNNNNNNNNNNNMGL